MLIILSFILLLILLKKKKTYVGALVCQALLNAWGIKVSERDMVPPPSSFKYDGDGRDFKKTQINKNSNFSKSTKNWVLWVTQQGSLISLDKEIELDSKGYGRVKLQAGGERMFQAEKTACDSLKALLVIFVLGSLCNFY